MSVIIDARGLACPQPVILAKKAIEENEAVTVLVDNEAAVENIRRMAAKMGCSLSISSRGRGEHELSLARTAATPRIPLSDTAIAAEMSCDVPGKNRQPLVVILSDNHMGSGNDELGDILIQSFIHTLLQLTPPPDTIICYNNGVKLAAEGSAVLEEFQQLEQRGTDVQICGTCVNYFGLREQIAVGHISNMYDIVETMAGAARLLRP